MTPDMAREFRRFHNYVALPRSEAFRIEYWALEEAKLQRMPAEKEFSRQVALVVGDAPGASKVTKAAELGVPVIDEAAFVELLETGELPG